MKKNIMMGILGLSVLGSAALASGVFAQNRDANQYGPEYTPERHTQMTQAFANNDYAAWKKLMGDKGATRVVTQENFSKFTEMHNLMVEGKTDEAAKIREELGLGNGQGHRENRGEGKGQGQGRNGSGFVDSDGDGACDRV
jgi:hypothetical protein